MALEWGRLARLITGEFLALLFLLFLYKFRDFYPMKIPT